MVASKTFTSYPLQKKWIHFQLGNDQEITIGILGKCSFDNQWQHEERQYNQDANDEDGQNPNL